MNKIVAMCILIFQLACEYFSEHYCLEVVKVNGFSFVVRVAKIKNSEAKASK